MYKDDLRRKLSERERIRRGIFYALTGQLLAPDQYRIVKAKVDIKKDQLVTADMIEEVEDDD